MFDAIKSDSSVNSQGSDLINGKPALSEAVSLAEIGQIQAGSSALSLPAERLTELSVIDPSAMLQDSVSEGLQGTLFSDKTGALLASSFKSANSQISENSDNRKDTLLVGPQHNVMMAADLQAAWQRAIVPLITESIDSETEAQLQSALGQQWSANNIQQVVIDGIRELKLELLPAETLQAKGAFAAENQTIYISEDWASQQSLDAVVDVVLEEVGHFVDYKFGEKFGTPDTAGDEGAIFSALLQGKPLTLPALAELQSEVDQGQLVVNNQVIDVEHAARSRSKFDRSVGTFFAGRDGKATIDFLFDGSRNTGEVAVFSLKGMDNLDKKAFIKEAARRALKGGRSGQIVINDKAEAAQFSGRLDEPNYNRGQKAKTRTVTFASRDRFAFIFAPKGSIREVAAGKQEALFSLSDYNPGRKHLFGRTSKTVIGVEENARADSNNDYNDIIFRVRGAARRLKPLSKLIPDAKNWLNNPVARPFLKPGTSGDTGSQKPPVTPVDPITPIVPPTKPSGGFTSDISTSAVKVDPSWSEAELIKRGAKKVKIGTQTVYIGTQQVTSINQNPVMYSFDSANRRNNWTRTDIETTGTDGRGLGLAWTGKGLYAVFSVDGTQGSKDQDFRRATGSATQSWLKSYGSGGGAKIAVIGQIDPASGKLLKAAHLSAVLSSGKTNSLNVTDITVNNSGNLVVKAQSYSNPRRPDGRPMTRNPGNTAGTPFDYALEIAPDLSKVLRTSAPGWS